MREMRERGTRARRVVREADEQNGAVETWSRAPMRKDGLQPVGARAVRTRAVGYACQCMRTALDMKLARRDAASKRLVSSTVCRELVSVLRLQEPHDHRAPGVGT